MSGRNSVVLHHPVFLNFRKAYDSVPVNKLCDSLTENVIGLQYINEYFYTDNRSCIKIRQGYLEYFTANTGPRHRCCLFPTIFKTYWISTIKNCHNQCNRIYIQLTADQAVIAANFDDIVHMIRTLMEERNN